ncbi:ComEC/Rec2 family competence protein [Moritella viscosa]|uniref:ComEC/Rec2 family competence protein n=1 Tax=Moritella viscosa TaxID=80854 RepID=UPI000922A75E|nr:MBL fold metallo-hydrolase [Moritella viscosa]SHO08903.1 Putative uncharacterized protein [Moritella viscosa]
MQINKTLTFVIIFLSSLWPATSAAQVDIRVVDVGPGLCVLASDTANNKYFLYDAGRWTNKNCYNYVRSKIGNNNLSLIVISHSDADHLSNLPAILQRNTAELIVHTGYKRRSDVWREANHAMSLAAKEGASIINLSSLPLSSVSNVHQFGDMNIEFIYGQKDWDNTSEPLAENHRRNAVSIIVKLSAYDKSILFTGDTVGRHSGDDDSACKYAEQAVVNSPRNIQSNILIAPHHGADNASSSCFISAINPNYIIFSAGHQYQHPRTVTLNRIKNTIQIPDSHIFRTDRGDDEGSNEWDYQRIQDCKDKVGDDDISININDDSSITIGYVEPNNIC